MPHQLLQSVKTNIKGRAYPFGQARFRIILEKTPPEISSDIIDAGIYITGGSANIRKIDKLFAKETELDIMVAEDPANTVVNGLGKILEDSSKYDCLAFTLKQTYYGG